MNEYLKEHWLNFVMFCLIGIQVVCFLMMRGPNPDQLPISFETQAVLLLVTRDDPQAQAIVGQYGDTITRQEFTAMMVKLKEQQRAKATPKN